ncbi:MAG: hypothetical protein DWQ19_10000 [Crenarchaeota archaeon]|nr:MAG: hypothetical protein DWQ19_10000 [Thermoproteota archaeon]
MDVRTTPALDAGRTRGGAEVPDLEKDMSYLSIEQCKDRHLYRIFSRNLVIGVFNSVNDGFIGIRYKFGEEYLDTEYHWDAGGTVKPQEEIGILPDDILVAEDLGTIESKTGKALDWSPEKKWFFVETGESLVFDRDNFPTSKPNDKLFNYLKERENENNNNG